MVNSNLIEKVNQRVDMLIGKLSECAEVTDEYLALLDDLIDMYRIGIHPGVEQAERDLSAADFIHDSVDALISDSGEVSDSLKRLLEKHDPYAIVVGRACLLYASPDEKDRYRIAADTFRRALDDIDRNEVCATAYVMPFYTEYETRYNNKNGYNDICDSFRMAAAKVAAEPVSGIHKALFLKGIVNTLDVMSVQIYEDYRQLRDILEQNIRKIAWNGLEEYLGDRSFADNELVKAYLNYALTRSVIEGHVSSEKYGNITFEENRSNNAL